MKAINWIFQTLLKLAFSAVVLVISAVALVVALVLGVVFWPINKGIEIFDKRRGYVSN
jgi:hypothetical protein